MLAASILAGASGQISSSTADHRDSLAYPEHSGKDPLFVFYQDYQTFQAGSLTASHTVPGDYEFRWQKYNPDTDGFDPPFSTETGVSSSTVSDLTDGGYRVSISGGPGPDTSMMAWVIYCPP